MATETRTETESSACKMKDCWHCHRLWVRASAFKRSVVDVRGAVAEGSCCRPLAYLTQVSPC